MSDGPFKLAASDVASNTWAKLERRLLERLQMLRSENDSPLDAAATATVRGRIAELKLLLQAAQKDPPPIDLG